MRGAGGEEVRIERGGRRGCLWCEDKSVGNVMECQESSLDPFNHDQLSRCWGRDQHTIALLPCANGAVGAFVTDDSGVSRTRLRRTRLAAYNGGSAITEAPLHQWHLQRVGLSVNDGGV